MSTRSLQRRQIQFNALEPVVQILAELAALHEFVQVAVTCANELKIDLDGCFSAERRDLVFLDHAQQPRLQRERHVADFIEKERAAIGLHDLAAPSFALRAGERARTIAKQFAFDQIFGQRGAIHRRRTGRMRAG